jgi:hypothetical protein
MLTLHIILKPCHALPQIQSRRSLFAFLLFFCLHFTDLRETSRASIVSFAGTLGHDSCKQWLLKGLSTFVAQAVTAAFREGAFFIVSSQRNWVSLHFFTGLVYIANINI